jgi:hypothetical protein
MRQGPHKSQVTSAIALGAAVALAALMWACASREPIPIASAPPPTPTAAASPAPQAAATPQWNLFPDFTTGKIDVYKDGEYVGSITGDEPEDPPMPHKDQRQLDPTFP